MSLFRKRGFGIRSKVYTASIVIAFMLLLSGLVAFFEFGRMTSYVSEIITNSIRSVEMTRQMQNMCDGYHADLFRQISDGALHSQPETMPAGILEGMIEDITSVVSTPEEKAMVDSLRYACSAYMQVALEVEAVWLYTSEVRQDWYFNRLQIVYDRFRGYLTRLSDSSQTALTNSYDSVKDSYYRSIMPGVVTSAASIVLLILFTYFLSLYVLKPIRRIAQGLKAWKAYGKKYDVTFDYGGDQLQDINEEIRELVDENISLRKKRS